MAGDWIKIETRLPQKPEVMQLAFILGIDELHVVGHLVLFWSWCDGQMSRECPVVIGTKKGLDRAACRDGFADAMIAVGWLISEPTKNGVSFQIPNMDHHLSKSAKTRATEAKKKEKQRSNVLKVSRSCPDANGTDSGLEKRREEYVIGPDVVVPEKLNNASCTTAAGQWFSYLLSKGLDDKVPEANSPQEQAFWKHHAKLTSEEFVASVEQSMAQGWKTIVTIKPDARPTTRGQQANINTDWIKALKSTRQHPTDWESRKAAIGAELFEAVKRTGTAEVAAVTSYNENMIRQIFFSHLEDIRNAK